MNYCELESEIRKKGSFLCVGLDTDVDLIPEFLKDKENSIFEFNKAIVDATHSYSVAYKPNLAFYESYGVWGLKQLEMTVEYIRSNYPELFIIADAKRGDIGNTAQRYAACTQQSMQC